MQIRGIIHRLLPGGSPKPGRTLTETAQEDFVRADPTEPLLQLPTHQKLIDAGSNIKLRNLGKSASGAMIRLTADFLGEPGTALIIKRSVAEGDRAFLVSPDNKKSRELPRGPGNDPLLPISFQLDENRHLNISAPYLSPIFAGGPAAVVIATDRHALRADFNMPKTGDRELEYRLQDVQAQTFSQPESHAVKVTFKTGWFSSAVKPSDVHISSRYGHNSNELISGLAVGGWRAWRRDHSGSAPDLSREGMAESVKLANAGLGMLIARLPPV